ncbi:major facilitator superfamily domain-containing protein [Immersiella caudata]|uniref:Major facilitator superfamily domain-containing protein n=1 Tax=Immersiella caudata TaxID=314043 RepID=A0AA40CCB8_9PEZI|nr:major facilitator superfamily domain-containing protein [Immersiella caudata]
MCVMPCETYSEVPDFRSRTTTVQRPGCRPQPAASPRPANPRRRDNQQHAYSQQSLATWSTTTVAEALLRIQLRPKVTLLSFLLLVLLELGAGMSVPPTNEMMEKILCSQMHPESTRDKTLPWNQGGADDPCKNPDVQGYLAMLRGWSYTFEAIPGLICAVPYGILSDRWGRKPVLLLGILGFSLAAGFNLVVFLLSDIVPLWATWFGALFFFIGGTAQMVVAMLYTFLADVTPVAERATVFFRIAAAFLVSNMIASALAGVIMAKSDWVALDTGIALLFLSLPLGFLFPETLHLHAHGMQKARQERRHRQTNAENAGGGGEEHEGLFATKQPALQILWSKARDSLAEVREFVAENKSLGFLVLSTVFIILGKFVTEMLLQYATKRYGWTWSKATLLLTIRSAVSLVILLGLLPLAGRVCVTRFGMSSMSKDLWLARFSGVAGVVGCLIIALAGSGEALCIGLVWLSLGVGLSQLTRSLLNSLIEEHHVGIVNSLLSLMEQGGIMLAGPLLGKSLSVGMELGGPWIGLPFMVAAVFMTAATMIVFLFRLPARP